MISLSDLRSWSAWSKPDRRPIYDWAARSLELPASFSMPGRFDVSRSLPLVPVFDGIQNELVRSVHFRKPPRYGGTLIADIAIPWIVCNDPGPIMWAWQSDQAGEEHMREKAWPAWKSCRQFMALLPENRHDATNSEIFFGPFFLVVNGCGPNALQSKGIRWLFCDEVWLPQWQKSFQWAIARTRDYEKVGTSKVVTISHAGNAGDVEDKQWKNGNQCVWSIKCDDGEYRPLSFGGKRADGTRWGLVFNDDAKQGDGTYDIARACETARYETEHGQTWLNCPRTGADWNRNGKYVAQNPSAPSSALSYSVNALMNRDMGSLVKQKLEAMQAARSGDIGPLKVFKQQCEALPWEEEKQTITITTQKSGYKLEQYFNGEKWDGETDRFMTIDRQRGMAGDVPHWWVSVRAWKDSGDSRLVYVARHETVESVRAAQLRLGVQDKKVMQDAGFDAPNVYDDCARYGWIASFGSQDKFWVWTLGNGKVRLPYSQFQRTAAPCGKSAFFLHHNGDYEKDILSRLLSGQGAKFEFPDDMPEEWLDHYKAEVKQEVKPGKFAWRKIHSTKDNHLWDCDVMQICYALIAKKIGLAPVPESEDQP